MNYIPNYKKDIKDNKKLIKKAEGALTQNYAFLGKCICKKWYKDEELEKKIEKIKKQTSAIESYIGNYEIEIEKLKKKIKNLKLENYE